MKNKGFSHLKTRLFIIKKTSKNCRFGGPMVYTLTNPTDEDLRPSAKDKPVRGISAYTVPCCEFGDGT